METINAIITQRVVDTQYFVLFIIFTFVMLHTFFELPFRQCIYYLDFLFKKYNRKERRTFYKKHGIEVIENVGHIWLLSPGVEKYYGKNMPRRKRFLFFLWVDRIVWISHATYVIIGSIAMLYSFVTDYNNYRTLLLHCFNSYVVLVVFTSILTLLLLIPLGVVEQYIRTWCREYKDYWRD